MMKLASRCYRPWMVRLRDKRVVFKEEVRARQSKLCSSAFGSAGDKLVSTQFSGWGVGSGDCCASFHLLETASCSPFLWVHQRIA